jgi:ParB/RepB/Spo0J family partition protein
MSNGTLLVIPIADIEENPVALRTVDRDSQKYADLVSSIRGRGILNPISVRQDGECYIVIDGLHRYSAALDAGLEEIPVQVLDIDEEEVLEVQIEANLQKVETKPGEYTKQLLRVMANHPNRTVEEQAKRLHQSPSWLKERLQLKNLTDEAMRRIDLPDSDPEHISVSNAYSLAKLPEDAQEDWIDRASSLSPSEFIPACLAEVKRLRTKSKTGQVQLASGPPVALRKRGDLRSEFERALTLPTQVPDDQKAFAEGYRAAFTWMFKQDDASIAAWKAEEAEREAEKQAKKEAKEKEKAEKAAKDGEAPSLGKLLGVEKKKADEDTDEDAGSDE